MVVSVGSSQTAHRSGIAIWLRQARLSAFVTICGITSASARDSSEYDGARLQSLVNAAHVKYKDLKDGANANYIPILDTVPSDLFGVVIITNDGKVFAAGDCGL